MADAATITGPTARDALAPLAVTSSYKTQEDFDAALESAAQRLARWRGLRLQWYLLTIVGVVLIVLTIIKLFVSVFSVETGTFIPTNYLLWAWTIAVGWCLAYFYSMRRLSDKIVNRRLCLRCAASLLDAETDEDGSGVCPRCCCVFSLGDYMAPSQNVAGLQAVLQRVKERLPTAFQPTDPQGTKPVPIVVPRGGLYRDRRHFDQVMRRAARRHLIHGRGLDSLQIGLIGAALPATVVSVALYTIGVEWMFLFGLLGIGLLIGAALIGLTLWAHTDGARARLINKWICLACGYSLLALHTDERGCSKCPECGRRFHPEEYTAPQRGAEYTNWQMVRRILFRELSANLDPKDERHRDPAPQVILIGYPPKGVPPPRDSVSQCLHCGYWLVGTPRNRDGEGICSECGKPFKLGPCSDDRFDSLHPLDRARMEVQTHQPDPATTPPPI